MNSPIISVRRLENSVFSCTVKISLGDRSLFFKPFDIEIQALGELKTTVFRKSLYCDKTIIPEVDIFMMSNEQYKNLYTNIGIIKFKIHTLTDYTHLCVICLYEGYELARVNCSLSSLTETVFSYDCTDYTIKASSEGLLNIAREKIYNIRQKLPNLIGIEWNQKTNYIVVDEVEQIFDHVQVYNPFAGFYTAYQNYVICCIFEKSNTERILVHETVHALLSSHFNNFQGSTERIFRVFVEAYCQYIMNVYSNRTSSQKRYLCSKYYLKQYLNDLESYFNEKEIGSYEYTDILFSYEFIPYIFSMWEDQAHLLGDILSLPNSFSGICQKLQRLISTIDTSDLELYAMEASALYGEAFSCLFNSDNVSNADNIIQYRKKVEFLYFGDY